MSTDSRPGPAPLHDGRSLDWGRAIEAYDQRWLIQEIAEDSEVHVSTVHRVLKASEVDRHPPRGRRQWTSVLTKEYLLSVKRLSSGEVAFHAGMVDETSTRAQRRTATKIVWEWRVKHGLQRPAPAVDPEQLRQWYREDDLTVAEIASKLGLGDRATQRHLRAAGITLRPPGRRPDVLAEGQITQTDTARLIGVSRSTVTRLVRDGHLDTHPSGGIDRSSVKRWLAGGTVGPA
jgi:AraC-like DNA-binding protein